MSCSRSVFGMCSHSHPRSITHLLAHFQTSHTIDDFAQGSSSSDPGDTATAASGVGSGGPGADAGEGELVYKGSIVLGPGTEIVDLRSWELPAMKASLAEEWTAGWKMVPPGGGPAHVFVAPAIDQREWGELIRQQVQKHGGQVATSDGAAARGGIKLNGLRWEVRGPIQYSLRLPY